MNIAVCLYGQARTGEYCSPWINKTFDHFREAGHKVDFFCDVEPYSHEINAKKQTKLEESNVLPLLHSFSPVTYNITNRSVIEELKAKHRAFYAPMARAICKSVYLKEEHQRVTDIKYDMVFVGRYDTILGPKTNSLYDNVMYFGIDPLTLYGGSNLSWRFNNEGWRPAFSDLFLMGDDLTIDLITASLYQVWATERKYSLFAHNTGPNTFLAKAVNDCGLLYKSVEVETAIVRMEANLSKPVFDSFHYHEQYWRTNHIGM